MRDCGYLRSVQCCFVTFKDNRLVFKTSFGLPLFEDLVCLVNITHNWFDVVPSDSSSVFCFILFEADIFKIQSTLRHLLYTSVIRPVILINVAVIENASAFAIIRLVFRFEPSRTTYDGGIRDAHI